MGFSNWLQFREQMPVTERWAYLDHAAVRPCPGRRPRQSRRGRRRPPSMAIPRGRRGVVAWGRFDTVSPSYSMRHRPR